MRGVEGGERGRGGVGFVLAFLFLKAQLRFFASGISTYAETQNWRGLEPIFVGTKLISAEYFLYTHITSRFFAALFFFNNVIQNRAERRQERQL